MGYIEQIFQADQVRRGGIVRRSVHDVERLVGLEALIEEAQDRNFHLLESGEQIIVICNQEGIVIHC